jgi:hypothetical protein
VSVELENLSQKVPSHVRHPGGKTRVEEELMAGQAHTLQATKIGVSPQIEAILGLLPGQASLLVMIQKGHLATRTRGEPPAIQNRLPGVEEITGGTLLLLPTRQGADLQMGGIEKAAAIGVAVVETIV